MDRSFFCRRLANAPNNPIANSPRVPGSGTELTVRVNDVTSKNVLVRVVPNRCVKFSVGKYSSVGNVAINAGSVDCEKSSHDVPLPGTPYSYGCSAKK